MNGPERDETVECEWCGATVSILDAKVFKPRNHGLTVCPHCLPGEDTPFGETNE